MDKEAYGEAYINRCQGLTIDFSKLFDYTTTAKATEGIENAVAFITKDTQDELARHPECDHAYIRIYLYSGRGSLASVWYGDSQGKVFRDNYTIATNGIRPYQMFNDNKEFYAKNEETISNSYIVLDTSKGNSVNGFIEGKLSQPDGVTEFMVYVDATSSRLYGLK